MTHAVRAVRNAGLYALHHLTVFAGILAFPLVLLSRRAGVPLPMGSVVSRIHDAYESTAESTDDSDADTSPATDDETAPASAVEGDAVERRKTGR